MPLISVEKQIIAPFSSIVYYQTCKKFMGYNKQIFSEGVLIIPLYRYTYKYIYIYIYTPTNILFYTYYSVNIYSYHYKGSLSHLDIMVGLWIGRSDGDRLG